MPTYSGVGANVGAEARGWSYGLIVFPTQGWTTSLPETSVGGVVGVVAYVWHMANHALSCVGEVRSLSCHLFSCPLTNCGLSLVGDTLLYLRRPGNWWLKAKEEKQSHESTGGRTGLICRKR